MSGNILAIDIDETCVEMWPMWLRWCNDSFGKSVWHDDVDWKYDLQSLFGEKAIDFWSDKDLYYNVEPMSNCVKMLETLKSRGWQIGFVSYAKKGHLLIS